MYGSKEGRSPPGFKRARPDLRRDPERRGVPSKASGRPIQRALRGASLCALALVALLCLGLTILSIYDTARRTRAGNRIKSVFGYLNVVDPIWEDRLHSVYVSVRNGAIDFTRYDKRCVRCGGIPPEHAPECIHSWAIVQYGWPPQIGKRVKVPGIKWVEGTFAGSRFTELSVSYWLVSMLSAAYPVVALIRGPLRTYGRRARGACLACGYDLTGNVSGRCPECGRVTDRVTGERHRRH